MSGMSGSEATRVRWGRIISEQRESGETVAGFCAVRGISVSSFYPWKRRLGPPGASEFVEAKVMGGDAVGGVTIELASGRRIIFERGFDRLLLLEVIQTLESGAGRGS